jgi:uncharacterized RDD family membrane protein YckC
MHEQKNHANPGSAATPCGLLRNFAAIIYDALIVVALWMIATALAMLAGFRELDVVNDPLYALYLLLVWCLYLTGFWHKGGMTVGMRAWRIRIVSEDGGLPGWGHCLKRFIASLISAASLGLGFVWPLFDPQQRSWHDILSRTRLLRH